jgi:hypothetical protein
MKVKIGNYPSYFGTYKLAEKLCFWVKDEVDEYGFKSKPDWVHDFGEWLTYGSVRPEPEVGEIRTLFDDDRKPTWLSRFLSWLNSEKQQKVYVRIDRWDTFSADHTLAHIILPLLKQLKDQKHGSPHVDDDDVPDHLRRTAAPPMKNEWDVDDNHHARWDWVMDEMIFSFESKLDDSWEDKFHTGKIDFAFKKLENGMSELIRGPEDDSAVDWEGKKEYQKRISNGFRLFGKYYEGLWT